MFRKQKMVKPVTLLILQDISILEILNTASGGKTVVVIPFGHFTANMPCSAISLDGAIGLFIAMIITIIVTIRGQTDHIMVLETNMAQEEAIQNGQIRVSLSAVCQNKERQNHAFLIGWVNALEEDGVLSDQVEAVLEVLENNGYQ